MEPNNTFLFKKFSYSKLFSMCCKITYIQAISTLSRNKHHGKLNDIIENHQIARLLTALHV